MKMENRIEGVFISFPPEELAEIKEELIRRGYEGDSSGIREYLCGTLFEDDDEETSADRLKGYMLDNPDVVRIGIDATVNLLRAIGGRK